MGHMNHMGLIPLVGRSTGQSRTALAPAVGQFGTVQALAVGRFLMTLAPAHHGQTQHPHYNTVSGPALQSCRVSMTHQLTRL